MNYLLLPFLIIISTTFAYPQIIPKNNTASVFSVGYENIITTDYGRTYKPGARLAGKFYYRPMEIDIWYPAINSKSGQLIEYGKLLNQLEERSNRFQDDTLFIKILHRNWCNT